MKIAGFKESSLNEWEGRVSSIVWTPGCNWRCPYCHAAHLIKKPNELELIDPQTVFDYIEKKDGWIDGVCISGGEPTLQGDNLTAFIEELKKKFDVGIKIETNGSNPQVIRRLLTYGLIDCLCLDFKQMPGTKLLQLARENSGLYEVLDTFGVAFRRSNQIEVEFHTTLCPPFINKKDIEIMGLFLHNKGLWVLQQYVPDDVLNPDVAGKRVFSPEELEELYTEAKKHHGNVILKNI